MVQTNQGRLVEIVQDLAEQAVAINGDFAESSGVDDWIGDIRDGMQNGFMGLDSTLDNYKRDIWYPRPFDHDAVGLWRSKGYPHLSQRIRAEVRERIASHNYELDADRRREIERITEDARQVVGA